MKYLSILTFITFVTVLSINRFSSKTEEKLAVLVDQDNKQEIFKMDPKKARALLDGLKDAVDKKAAKKETRPRTKRKVASVHKANPNAVKRYKKLMSEFDGKFLASEDNLGEVSVLRKEIIGLKRELRVKKLEMDKWDLEFIYYLVIEENLTLEEIAEIRDSEDISRTREEWQVMQIKARTDIFYRRILEFKGFSQEDIAKQSGVDAEAERLPATQIIKNLAERSSKSTKENFNQEYDDYENSDNNKEQTYEYTKEDNYDLDSETEFERDERELIQREE